MDALVLNSVATLSGIGIAAAGVLFIIAKKFKVHEDPKIDEIEEVLPAANCGGCGLPGCRNFAEVVVKTRDLESNVCPVGGNDTLQKMAKILGIEATEKEPSVAVLCCNGSKENSPQKVKFNGIDSCLLASNFFAGEGGCAYGCLGLGDCIQVCKFDALYIDENTGLPVVVEDKCTSCGACVDICPRALFEIRPRGRSGRVYAACKNQEKGVLAKKNCTAACIGCKKCVRVVKDDPEQASYVKVENLVCTIDPAIDVDKYGHQLVDCCPTKTIVGIDLPAKPIVQEEAKES